MIINNDEASKRLNSPLNLINRLKTATKKNDAMRLFIPLKKDESKKNINPFVREVMSSVSRNSLELSDNAGDQHPAENTGISLDEILEDSKTKIKLGLAHDSALDVLNKSINLLSTKLDDVSAGRLPATILAASKVVESIRRERNEAIKNNKDKEVHYHFYTPERKSLSDFEVIDVANSG